MNRGAYVLLLIPLVGVALICAALARIGSVWFRPDNFSTAAIWTVAGLLPFVLSIVAMSIGVRKGERSIVAITAVAAAFLGVGGVWVFATFGEGTLMALTFLPLYTWAVVVIALVLIGVSSGRRSKSQEDRFSGNV